MWWSKRSPSDKCPGTDKPHWLGPAALNELECQLLNAGHVLLRCHTGRLLPCFLSVALLLFTCPRDAATRHIHPLPVSDARPGSWCPERSNTASSLVYLTLSKAQCSFEWTPAISPVLSVDRYLKLFIFCILSTKPQCVLQSLNLCHTSSSFSALRFKLRALGTLGNDSGTVLSPSP